MKSLSRCVNCNSYFANERIENGEVVSMLATETFVCESCTKVLGKIDLSMTLWLRSWMKNSLSDEHLKANSPDQFVVIRVPKD